MRRRDVEGTIYLIHFERPFKHARHYIGWTEGDVDAREIRHLEGRGSPLLRAVDEASIAFSVVRTWKGTRKLERQLKNRKKASKLCPECKECSA